jgi:hypothetical protein
MREEMKTGQVEMKATVSVILQEMKSWREEPGSVWRSGRQIQKK